MGIRDLFRRRPSTAPSGTHQSAPTRDEQPGSVSEQTDTSGDGPVGLQDRTAPGGQGLPDTNQGKTEPMPATPGQPDPNAPFEPPSLDEMNVGGADPQSPNLPGTRPRDVPSATVPPAVLTPGVAPDDDRPALDGGSTSKLPEGPERPAQSSEGVARRAPGQLGVSPEQQETDVDSGAAAMRPGGGYASTPSPDQAGDSQGVPVPHSVPAPGTSEESPIAHGVRTPGSPGSSTSPDPAP